MLTNKIILWGFKEETEHFYRPWAYAFCEKTRELQQAIARAWSDKRIDKTVLNEIKRISYINPYGAFQFAAKKIIEMYYSDKTRTSTKEQKNENCSINPNKAKFTETSK